MPTLFPHRARIELGLLLAGCILLWLYGLRASARARAAEQAARMPAWPLSPSQFFLFLWLVICGGLVLQWIVSATFKARSLQRRPGPGR